MKVRDTQHVQCYAVTMDHDNTDLVVGGFITHPVRPSPIPEDCLYRLRPKGNVTSIANALAFSGTGGGIVLHHDGASYLEAVRVHIQHVSATTVTSFLYWQTTHRQDSMRVMARDAEGDDLVVGAFVGGSQVGVFQVDYRTRTMSTLVSGQSGVPTYLAHEPRSDLFILGSNWGSFHEIQRIDRRGKLLKTWGISTRQVTAMEIYGSRHVTGAGSAKAGTNYAIAFSFPRMPGGTYLAALSFAPRPGIALSGGVLNLAPDGLFQASVAGLFVSKFTGTLDATGTAVGSVKIPSGLPAGLTFFCSGIAVSGSTIRLGNTIGITVRP